MRLFFGLLLIVAAVFITIRPHDAWMIIATSATVAGLIIMLPDGEEQ